MGSRLGVEKSAATKLGISVETWRARRAAGLLWCRVCRTWHHKDKFVIDKSRSTGRASLCRGCASEASTACRYRISVKELREWHTAQNGQCLICKRKRKLEIDHNHESGKIRGLLCSRCNGALGQFRDNIPLLKKAIQYLEQRDG